MLTFGLYFFRPLLYFFSPQQKKTKQNKAAILPIYSFLGILKFNFYWHNVNI